MRCQDFSLKIKYINVIKRSTQGPAHFICARALGLTLSEKPTALVFKKFAKLQMYFFSKNRYHLNNLYELSAKTLKDVFIGVDRRPTPPVFYTGEDTVIPILFKQIVSAHAAKAHDKT